MRARDRTEQGNRRKRKKRKNRRGLWLLAALSLLLAGTAAFLGIFRVREVTVEGNERYTDEELKQLLVGDGYANTLFLLIKSKYEGLGNLPFISEAEITAQSPGHIRIKVYEKQIVGYVQYLGTNLYFDKDGIVVESTAEVMDGIPQVSGLAFSEVTLYERLPVANEDTFRVILNLTQALGKYGMAPDDIHLSDSLEITLTFGEAKVLFGTSDYLEEKVTRLAAFIDSLEGQRGVLHMENFTEDTQNIVFKEDG